MIIGKIFRSYYVFGDFVLLAFRKEVDGAPVSFYPTQGATDRKLVRAAVRGSLARPVYVLLLLFLEYPTRVRLSTGKN